MHPEELNHRNGKSRIVSVRKRRVRQQPTRNSVPASSALAHLSPMPDCSVAFQGGLAGRDDRKPQPALIIRTGSVQVGVAGSYDPGRYSCRGWLWGRRMVGARQAVGVSSQKRRLESVLGDSAESNPVLIRAWPWCPRLTVSARPDIGGRGAQVRRGHLDRSFSIEHVNDHGHRFRAGPIDRSDLAQEWAIHDEYTVTSLDRIHSRHFDPRSHPHVPITIRSGGRFEVFPQNLGRHCEPDMLSKY